MAEANQELINQTTRLQLHCIDPYLGVYHVYVIFQDHLQYQIPFSNSSKPKSTTELKFANHRLRSINQTCIELYPLILHFQSCYCWSPPYSHSRRCRKMFDLIGRSPFFGPLFSQNKLCRKWLQLRLG